MTTKDQLITAQLRRIQAVRTLTPYWLEMAEMVLERCPRAELAAVANWVLAQPSVPSEDDLKARVEEAAAGHPCILCDDTGFVDARTGGGYRPCACKIRRIRAQREAKAAARARRRRNNG